MGVNNRWRRNPFTEIYNSVLITNEVHTIEYHAEVDDYGFFLNEAPRFDSPWSIVITGYTEVSRLTTPTGTQFRVDYLADTYWGTGFVGFDAALVGTIVTVDEYYGLGTILHPNFRLATNFNLPGKSTFESYMAFLDALAAERAVRAIDSAGSIWDMANIYESGGVFYHAATGRARRLRVEPNGIFTDVSSQNIGVAASWVEEGKIIPSGALLPYTGTTAPAAGWVLASGRTIGSVSSGATERANTDTYDLFVLYWSHTDAALPIYTSGGGAAVRASYASADAAWAANVRMTIPDLRGRTWVGKDDMGGTAASRVTLTGSGLDGLTLLAIGGAETHTLTISQMPSHTHAQNAHNHTGSALAGGTHSHLAGENYYSGATYKYGVTAVGAAASRYIKDATTGLNYAPNTSTVGNHTHTLSIANAVATNQNTGGGNAHNNVQPGIVGLYLIKL